MSRFLGSRSSRPNSLCLLSPPPPTSSVLPAPSHLPSPRSHSLGAGTPLSALSGLETPSKNQTTPSHIHFTPPTPADEGCEVEDGDYNTGLTIASIFIIFSASLLGAIIPAFMGRSQRPAFDKTVKTLAYAGAGVLLATGFLVSFLSLPRPFPPPNPLSPLFFHTCSTSCSPPRPPSPLSASPSLSWAATPRGPFCFASSPSHACKSSTTLSP